MKTLTPSMMWSTTPDGLRPLMLQTLRMAVDSGDAATAARLYASLAGKNAAERVGSRDVLDRVGGWLDDQRPMPHNFLHS